MTEENQLSEIKKRLETNAYFVNPLSDAHVADDIKYLLGLLDDRQKKLDSFQKKNEVLANHVLELSQEIENVKSDFGGGR